MNLDQRRSNDGRALMRLARRAEILTGGDGDVSRGVRTGAAQCAPLIAPYGLRAGDVRKVTLREAA